MIIRYLCIFYKCSWNSHKIRYIYNATNKAFQFQTVKIDDILLITGDTEDTKNHLSQI